MFFRQDEATDDWRVTTQTLAILLLLGGWEEGGKGRGSQKQMCRTWAAIQTSCLPRAHPAGEITRILIYKSVNFFRKSCLFFSTLAAKKEKKKMLVPLVKQKKTIRVFSPHLKADSTECSVHQHHKTSGQTITTVQPVSVSDGLSVHALGTKWGGGEGL